MRSSSHDRVGEAGFALATTVFLGAVALVMLAFIIARGIASTDVADNQIDWEVALNVAEGELDSYLANLATETDPDAITTGHLVADLGTRDAVIAEAESYAAVLPGAVVDAPGGEVVLLKPVDDAVVFAVGFVPDMSTVGRKARVVSARYEALATTITDVTIEYGLYGAGDVDISGSALIESAGSEPADVHANGTLSPGSVTRIVDGCGTEAEDSGYNQPGCPTSPVEPLPVPQVEAIAYHELAWYDLCPDGAHYAPNHPTSPAGTVGVPCSGLLTATPAGWSGGASVWSIGDVVTGVFFVSGADIVGKPEAGSLATIIAHRTYGPGETVGTCGEGTGGSIALSPGSSLEGHPDTGSPPVVAVADGDIAISNSEIIGLVAAGETFDGTGPGTTTLVGAVVVTDRCDEGLNFNGNITLTYTGPFMTLFEATTTTNTTIESFDITLRSEI